jgi:hypothetical protein
VRADFEHVNRIKKDHADRLLSKANVVGVGVGPKNVSGQPTGELAIKVYVSRKVEPQSLTPEDLVEESIEGVPTDVEVQAPMEAR